MTSFYKTLKIAGLYGARAGIDLRIRFDNCTSKIAKITDGTNIDPAGLMEKAIEIAKTTANDLEQAVNIVINDFQRKVK